MALVAAAFCPHPPILIPNIGKTNRSRLKNTEAAFLKIKDGFNRSGVETIAVISPHGPPGTEFSASIAPSFSADFRLFGDFQTKIEAGPELGLPAAVREAAGNKFPVRLISRKNLDYGAAIPLYQLSGEKTAWPVAAFGCPDLPLSDHYGFGRLLGQTARRDKNRIGLIASGDLSHRLTKGAPGGFSPKAKKFDRRIIELLLNEEYESIAAIDQTAIEDAGECGLKSLVMLLGALAGMRTAPTLLSYEYPFGVGYLVFRFIP